MNLKPAQSTANKATTLNHTQVPFNFKNTIMLLLKTSEQILLQQGRKDD